MKELELSVSDIKDLMNTFSKNRLGCMELSVGGFSLKLEGGKQEQIVAAAAQPVLAVSRGPAPEQEAAVPDGNIVTAPIVGTFYEAPAPDKAPYVTVGANVKKGDVLFIIESMKLMNEVTSELDGTVSRILVQNASPVEYGQPIMVIE